ncbi:MAG: efflux RND transporter periplasmic adaptor subunit [Methylococcales bacterium]
MIKRMLIMLIVVGLLLGGVFWFIHFKGRMMKQFMTAQGEPAQTVSTLTATYQEWLPKLEAVGSLHAVQGVELSAEIPGIVSELHFKQGDDIVFNTPILQLRVNDDTAKLAALSANAELARMTYQRAQAQFNVQAISRQSLDIEKANLLVAQANVAQQQALINKKTIRAPFTGRIGIRQVDVGQYLKEGAAIATLQALDPIFVDFFVPQQNLSTLKVGQTVTLQVDTYPTQKFSGTISVINPKIEINTRNAQIRATLKNPGHTLLPGMYANVAIGIGAAQRYITVPRSAITFNPFGSTVFLVQNGNKNSQGNPKLLAKQTFVTTGETRGDQIAVLKGIQEGDTIVTSGQIKLHNGSQVQVNNAVQPSNDAAPQPQDQ